MPDVLALSSGLRLRSQVCATEVIVIHPGARAFQLQCGGVPMIARDAGLVQGPGSAGDREPDPRWAGGTVLGKRYTRSDDESVEILVTRAGQGSLTDGRVALVVKAPRQLPASD
jgi:hypothetical protein